MGLTHFSADNQNVSAFNLSALTSMTDVSLADNALASAKVDYLLSERAKIGLSNGVIDVGGNNSNRTRASDSTLVSLVTSGYQVTVNQVNDENTVLGFDAFSGANASGDVVGLTRFLCNTDCIANSFGIRCNMPGHVKTGLYKDDAGTIGDLVVADNIGVEVAGSQWNRIFTPYAFRLESGLYYWLGGIGDTLGIRTYSSSPPGVSLSKNATYADWTFQNPAGSGWTSGSAQLGFRIRI